MSTPTLEDLLDELARGRVYETSLRAKRWVVEGLMDGQSIYIDPRPSIVDTVIHECLHRLKPKWGERTVRRHTARLMSQMDEKSMRRVYQAYRRVAKKCRPVNVELE